MHIPRISPNNNNPFPFKSLDAIPILTRKAPSLISQSDCFNSSLSILPLLHPFRSLSITNRLSLPPPHYFQQTPILTESPFHKQTHPQIARTMTSPTKPPSPDFTNRPSFSSLRFSDFTKHAQTPRQRPSPSSSSPCVSFLQRPSPQRETLFNLPTRSHVFIS